MVDWDEVTQTGILYYTVKPPIPIISQREVVGQWSVCKNWPDARSNLMVLKSCEHTQFPETPDYVRADSFFAIYVVQEGPDVYLTFMVRNDLRGNIPKKMVNAIAGKQPGIMAQNIKNGLKMLGKL